MSFMYDRDAPSVPPPSLGHIKLLTADPGLDRNEANGLDRRSPAIGPTPGIRERRLVIISATLAFSL
jgi:hypothetical protein